MPWIPSGSGFGVTLYPSPFCSVHQKPDPCANHLSGLGAPAFWLPVAFRAMSEREEGVLRAGYLFQTPLYRVASGWLLLSRWPSFVPNPGPPPWPCPSGKGLLRAHC